MICLVCGEPMAGPVVIRLRQGGVRFRKAFGIEFVDDEFEDGAKVKWIHNTCAVRLEIFPHLLKHDTCSLCRKQLEPMETGQPSDCVLLVERGVIEAGRRSSHSFDAQQGGCVHYWCAIDDWHLNVLLSLISEAV